MRNTKLILACFVSLGLMACGGSTGSSTPSQARSLANRALGVIQALRLNQSPDISSVPGVRPGGATVFSLTTPACVTQTPTSTVDMDGDGIPLTLSSTYSCADQSYGAGYTWSSYGTWKIEDTDDTKKWLLGGYTSDWNFSSEYTYPSTTGTCSKVYPGGHSEYTGRGSYNLVANTSNAYIYQSNYQGSVNFTQGTYTGDYTYEGQWSGKVTPDASVSASNPWSKGSISYSGQWQYSGNFPDEDEEHGSSTQNHDRGNVIMTLQTKNLTYDNSCSAYYNSGEFLMDYGDGSTFKIVYACNSADTKYYYNGVEYDPYATSSPSPTPCP